MRAQELTPLIQQPYVIQGLVVCLLYLCLHCGRVEKKALIHSTTYHDPYPLVYTLTFIVVTVIKKKNRANKDLLPLQNNLFDTYYMAT